MTNRQSVDIERVFQQIGELENLAAAMDLPNAPTKENLFRAATHGADLSVIDSVDVDESVDPDISNQGWPLT